ncbi:MAG TPA: MlaD family protein [Candidatus Baltobacteraceae bacterium]|nr:MlaD family protein [Candidatus Baltobacteraceae bacterium]
MSRQAQVGAFALLALLLLFAVFYVITDFGTRHTGYRIGVHFQSAAGLHSGALVYFSGVTVGSVDSITLLADNTVDVILAINRDVDIPRESRFLIQAPLTGDPNLIIVPPVPHPSGVFGAPRETARMIPLERRVLPIDQQPEGQNTATIADLLQQGQGEVVKLDAMLDELSKREPKLLDTLQSTLTNADELTASMKTAIGSLSAQLQSSLGEASANLVALTGTLNDTTQLNSHRITDILVQFQQTSHALNTSMASLESMVTDPALHTSVLATTKNIADTTENIAGITHDLRSITSDPQTQAELKNTVANLDATMQRANSLLGALGGTSRVYGVDEGATPYPLPTMPASAVPGANASPAPLGTPLPTAASLHLRNRLTRIASNLISIQLRMSELSAQKVCCPNGLYSSDRGPQTDLDATLLPNSSTSLFVGANDIGYHTTTNLALLHSLNDDTRVGGGILYSQLGLIGQYNAGVFGLDTRFYDPRRPQLDIYGNLHLTRNLELFYGERAINHAERRFSYGLQTQFP